MTSRRNLQGPRASVGLHRGVAFLLTLLLAASGSDAAAAERESLTPAAGQRWVRLTRPIDDAAALKELAVEQGKSIAVRPDYAVKRVSVGNPEVLDVVVLSPRELQFVAKRIGSTNVLVWDTDNQIEAVIDVHVGAPYSGVSSELRETLQNDQISVRGAGDSVVLSGHVTDGLQLERALALTRAYLPAEKRDRVINLLEVGGGQQIMLEVVVAEMSRSLTRSLGTNFHTVIGDDGTVFELFNFLGQLTSIESREFTFDLSSFELTNLETLIDISQTVSLAGSGFGVGSGIYEFFFDLLERNGLGKILAEPTLVARSGETANFLVGGEIPIPIAQGGAFGSITVEFKQFGVGLAFTPTVLSPGRIHLNVRPEVSEPDFAFGTSVSGTVVPGFRTRRASTGIDLGDGQSFAIAGLLNEQVAELISQYPVIGDIPVLGALFRSSSFQKRETELVMIITPRIVKPLGPGPHPLPTDHFIEPSAFEFYLLGSLEARAEPEPLASSAEGGGAIESPGFGGMLGGAGHRVPSSGFEEVP